MSHQLWPWIFVDISLFSGNHVDKLDGFEFIWRIIVWYTQFLLIKDQLESAIILECCISYQYLLLFWSNILVICISLFCKFTLYQIWNTHLLDNYYWESPTIDWHTILRILSGRGQHSHLVGWYRYFPSRSWPQTTWQRLPIRGNLIPAIPVLSRSEKRNTAIG